METKKKIRSKEADSHRFWNRIAEAKKSPRFEREIKAFIKATTSVYKLE